MRRGDANDPSAADHEKPHVLRSALSGKPGPIQFVSACPGCGRRAVDLHHGMGHDPILRKACNEWEWIDRVPKVSMCRDKEGQIRSQTREEFARLICELPEHLADMARFSVATGLRQANVTRLQWKQISLARRHLWVSGADHKNGRPQAVPFNQVAIDVLEKRKGDHSTHVFTYEGKPIVQVNPRPGATRYCAPEYSIFAGMICDIRLLPGTEKWERLRTSCNAWVVGKHNPWWSDMLTWHLKACNLRQVGSIA